MFIAVFDNSYQRFIGEGETIAEAIVDLEGYMEKKVLTRAYPITIRSIPLNPSR